VEGPSRTFSPFSSRRSRSLPDDPLDCEPSSGDWERSSESPNETDRATLRTGLTERGVETAARWGAVAGVLECGVSESGLGSSGSGFGDEYLRVQCLGLVIVLRMWGLRFRVEGVRVWGLGFEVAGSRLRVYVLGLRVWGSRFGFGVHG